MGWWRGHCWDPLHVACMAVVVTVCHRCCRRFIISCDRHHALMHNAWVLQPSGGWLREVTLALLNCSGGCTLWWALVVAARAVGCWAISTARLCTAPGPLGPVDGGLGGCHWCCPIIFTTAALCGCWWVTAQSFHAISIARFCAMRCRQEILQICKLMKLRIFDIETNRNQSRIYYDPANIYLHPKTLKSIYLK